VTRVLPNPTVAPLDPRASSPPSASAPVWVIASGKGGVGKSAIAVLLAAEWSSRGVRTLLFDAVQNEGTLHLLLGRAPARRIDAVLLGDVAPATLVEPLDERLALLPAPADESLPPTISPLDRARVHLRLAGAFDGFGAVIVDAGPGRADALRAATLRATGVAVVATPEPASLADAYATLKLAKLQAPHLSAGLIVNRATCAEEADEVHARLDLATRKFLGCPLARLGTVPESAAICRATRVPGGLRDLDDATVRDAVRALADALGAPSREARS